MDYFKSGFGFTGNYSVKVRVPTYKTPPPKILLSVVPCFRAMPLI